MTGREIRTLGNVIHKLSAAAHFPFGSMGLSKQGVEENIWA